MMVLLAVVLGAVIGVSLGALGGGGSILTVPALVYAIGEPAGAATTGSLVIVGVTALVSTIGHTRSGHVRWTAGLSFGLVGVAASYLGTDLNRRVDPNALLLAFAALMLVAAAAMLFRNRPHDNQPTAPRHDQHRDGPDSGATPARTATAVAAPATTTTRTTVTPAMATKVVAAGLAVGFLTGFLGVGGGFIIVPALVMALGYPMPIAVGTSLLVIAVNSAASLAERAGHDSFHWNVIIPFTVAAIAGSLAGKKVADHLDGVTLTRAFAGLLIAVAVYTAIRSASGLS